MERGNALQNTLFTKRKLTLFFAKKQDFVDQDP